MPSFMHRGPEGQHVEALFPRGLLKPHPKVMKANHMRGQPEVCVERMQDTQTGGNRPGASGRKGLACLSSRSV